MFSSLTILAAFAALATAQNSSSSSSNGYNSTNIDYPYALTPAFIATLNITTTGPWCQAQQNSCPQVCGGQAFPNTCDTTTLAWSCKCTVGQTPNITMYLQTIPRFECLQYRANCVAANPTDAYQQQLCNLTPCGTIDPASILAAASSSAAIASTAKTSTTVAVVAATSGTAVVTTTAGAASTVTSVATSAAAAATSHAAANVLNVGSATFGAGLLALFGMAI